MHSSFVLCAYLQTKKPLFEFIACPNEGMYEFNIDLFEKKYGRLIERVR